MNDTIFIHGIMVHARHGMLNHEAEVGQRFVIDVELFVALLRSLTHGRTDRHRLLCGRS